jgi:hypothetical protein
MTFSNTRHRFTARRTTCHPLRQRPAEGHYRAHRSCESKTRTNDADRAPGPHGRFYGRSAAGTKREGKGNGFDVKALRAIVALDQREGRK